MKSFLSLLIRALRYCFYNTPVKHWRITSYLYAQVSRLQTGKERFPIVSFEGVKLKVNAQDGVLTAGLVNNHFERFTLRIFKQLLKEEEAKSATEPCIFVNVGANIGVFTAVAAASNSRWQVYAFEPNPATYQLLLDNIELNGLRDVTPVNAAVGEAGGKASLDISSHSAALHSLHGIGSERIEVPILSLDDFCLAHASRPRLFKIDVEGYEPQVLNGMKSLLQGDSINVILEFNPELLKLGGRDPKFF